MVIINHKLADPMSPPLKLIAGVFQKLKLSCILLGICDGLLQTVICTPATTAAYEEIVVRHKN
jgi:hypothetical protein